MLWDVIVNRDLWGGAAGGALGRKVHRGEDHEHLTVCGDSSHPVEVVLHRSLLQAGYSDRDEPVLLGFRVSVSAN